ncbi:MAG: hypothetical protein AB7P76_07685 [Candidatus Melainabacteria bacterium]
MGVTPGISSTAIPAASPALPTAGLPDAGNGTVQTPTVFDQFQKARIQADNPVHGFRLLKNTLSHPVQTLQAIRHLKKNAAPGESLANRVQMYQNLYAGVGHTARKQLRLLLRDGILANHRTDDGHSTLYHLNTILSTPRARGFSNQTLTEETIRLLNTPYVVSQKFTPLSENIARQMLMLRNNPEQMLNRNNSGPGTPLTWEDIQGVQSATCVSSSMTFYMAEKLPGEFTRHIAELTSPMQAFYEKVSLSDLSPEDPQKAYQILAENQIQYRPSGPGELWVKVELPQAGLLRAVNSNRRPVALNDAQGTQTGVEAAYQFALTYLGTRTYDPAVDLRTVAPGVQSKGLQEGEKARVETIVKDSGPIQSVSPMVVGGDPTDPDTERGNAPHLFGYSRTYEQTINDILASLKYNADQAAREGQAKQEPVTVGIIYTTEDGIIDSSTGHEVTITAVAPPDPQTGDIRFEVVDSDDNRPLPVLMTARELIPQIHHMGLPLAIAQKANQEIAALNNPLIPDESDAQRFDNLPLAPLPPENATSSQAAVTAAPGNQATAQPLAQPVMPATASTQPPAAPPAMDWVPVPVGTPGSYATPFSLPQTGYPPVNPFVAA